jgi:hypothetical protein
MIPIKISDKKYSIKAISELTTAEFIELSKIENCNVIKYIAWQTGCKLEDSFFAVTSKTIEQAIGQAPDITKLPRPKGFDYTKTIDTVGQRYQIENSGLIGYPLLVFSLAVAQARSNNIDDVRKLEQDYLTRNPRLILPAGFFFFRNYRYGNPKGFDFLNLLRDLIKRRKPKRPLGLKG